MNERPTLDAHGMLIEPATLKIQRLLPGPIERVWAYLTESELRRKWLVAGEMKMKVGAPFELVWRNDELTNPPGQRCPASATSAGCEAGSPSSIYHASSLSLGKAVATFPLSWSQRATRYCSP